MHDRKIAVAEERITTLHPAGKQRVCRSLAKYETAREEIGVTALAEEARPFTAMAQAGTRDQQ